MTPLPDHLPADAAGPWYRIQGKLRAMGTWEPIDTLLLGVTAMQVCLYAHMVRRGLPVADLEPMRQSARDLLKEMLWLNPSRAHLAALNAHGHDLEILAVASPWPTASQL